MDSIDLVLENVVRNIKITSAMREDYKKCKLNCELQDKCQDCSWRDMLIYLPQLNDYVPLCSTNYVYCKIFKISKKSNSSDIAFPYLNKWIKDNYKSRRIFCDEINIECKHLYDILYGNKYPKMRTIRKILNVTGLNFEDTFIKSNYQYPNRTIKSRHFYKNEFNNNSFWPVIGNYFVKNRFSKREISYVLNCHTATVKNLFETVHDIEPNISYETIIRLLNETGDTFEHLFSY